MLLAGAWSWSWSPLCRNKYIQACIPHVLGSVGYHTGTNFPMQQNQKFSLGRDLHETFFIPKFSTWQAKASAIDFDYLSYFFLRYNEYKKQREACFSIAQDYLSRLIRSWKWSNFRTHFAQACATILSPFRWSRMGESGSVYYLQITCSFFFPACGEI